MTTVQATIQRRAIAIEQHPGHPLYLFVLAAHEILEIADISRVSRDEAGDLIGYQRPEVRRHVDEIVEYLDSAEVLFPNAIILALSPETRFRSSRGPNTADGYGRAGTLEIPLPKPGKEKPAWIVDGQQRALALSQSVRQDFPVPIAGFVADTIGLQRDQFLRVNNTRSLPRGLVGELLPEVATPLPSRLAARKIPSALTDLLNRDPESPFHELIRRASTPEEKRRKAVVTDTSIIKAIEESLNSPSGCLFPYRNVASGETDIDGIWAVLLTYWGAVRDTFPDAWGLPATKSRLMHGVGIRSMGRLMDRVMAQINPHVKDALQRTAAEVQVIAPKCHWTHGEWEEIGLAWNELQNVPKHIRVLSNYLVRAYISAKQQT